jgi:hypothetical protein
MSELKLQRICILMEPEPGNPQEVEGVLNPAAARGPDGHLYLFPRLVAKRNYSRIGIARVRFNADGDESHRLAQVHWPSGWPTSRRVWLGPSSLTSP